MAALVHRFRDWHSCAAADFGRVRDASREKYPLWSSIDEQQSTRPKTAQPFGLGRRRRLAALLAR